MLCICLNLAVGLKAQAQQSPASDKQRLLQIQQLSNEMQGLRQQLQSLKTQRLQAINQIKALNDQIIPMERKLKADADQVRGLVGKHA